MMVTRALRCMLVVRVASGFDAFRSLVGRTRRFGGASAPIEALEEAALTAAKGNDDASLLRSIEALEQADPVCREMCE